jgi:hypothetical protein
VTEITADTKEIETVLPEIEPAMQKIGTGKSEIQI